MNISGGITSSKQTVLFFKNMLAEYATLAALLKPCAPEENHLIQTKIFSDEYNF
jgi:hypothetical protein